MTTCEKGGLENIISNERNALQQKIELNLEHSPVRFLTIGFP